MISSRLPRFVLTLLLFLHVAVSAVNVKAQTATMVDLMQAQERGATEAELIAIYRSGLSVDSRDRNGITPLHVACHGKGYLFFAKMLVNEGADVNSAARKGWTPLMEASSEPGKAEIVRLLLISGALADLRKSDGQSALHIAVSSDDFASVRILLQARANINLQDSRGRTPVYYVTGFEIAKLLVEKGARLNVVDRNRHSPYQHIRNLERERFGPGRNSLSAYLKSLGAE
jgi:hypothetical protein